MFKNNRNKFMASAAALALVATAVAPAAGAEGTVTPNAESVFAFSDVSPGYTHFGAIYSAYEQGFMSGYQDGTFKPKQTLTRSNVVKALGKYVVATSGKKLSEYDLKNVVPYKDVPATYPDKELLTYSLIVKQAGIFDGDNGNLLPKNDITRQQMAKVLVKAFSLKDLSGKQSTITDNSKATAEYVPYINILSENGVTVVNEFNPRGKTIRGQFASFLVRAHGEVFKTPAQAIEDLENAVGDFEDLAEDFGFEITPAPGGNNTFNIDVPTEIPEDVSGTGFFQTLADQGVRTLKVADKTFMISDGKGTVTEGAQAAKVELATVLYTKNTVNITADVPYGEGLYTNVTYTFNLNK